MGKTYSLSPRASAFWEKICGIYQFLSCQYSYHDKFQVTNLTSLSIVLRKEDKFSFYELLQGGFNTPLPVVRGKIVPVSLHEKESKKP